MRCKKIIELLPGYAEDSLEARERAGVASHLDGCPRCADLLARLRRTGAALSGLPDIEPGPELLARLRSIPPAAPERRRRFPAFVLKPSLQPVLAGSFLALTAAAFLVFTPAGGRLLKTIDRQVHAGYDKIARLYARAESAADSLDGVRQEAFGSLKTLPPLGGGRE